MTEPMIFDTHTHMNDSAFSSERQDILQDFPNKGIGAFTEIGYDLESSKRAVELASSLKGEDGLYGEENWPKAYAAIGFHPDHVCGMEERDLEELSELSKSKKVVAFGEIGLDYYYIDKRREEEKLQAVQAKKRLEEIQKYLIEWYPKESASEEENIGERKPKGEDWSRLSISQKEYKSMKRLAETVDFNYDPEPEVQKNAFIRQIRLARKLQLPIVIHSREAARDTYELVKEEKAYENGGIVHCFSYSVEVARQYLKLGMYIGVGGVLTFPSGRKLKEVVKEIPLSSIVLETDAPYMAPVPFRGERNDSRNLPYVVSEIGRIKGISEEEVIRVTTENAKRVYRLV